VRSGRAQAHVGRPQDGSVHRPKAYAPLPPNLTPCVVQHDTPSKALAASGPDVSRNLQFRRE
jgi:hypothetical protein